MKIPSTHFTKCSILVQLHIAKYEKYLTQLENHSYIQVEPVMGGFEKLQCIQYGVLWCYLHPQRAQWCPQGAVLVTTLVALTVLQSCLISVLVSKKLGIITVSISLWNFCWYFFVGLSSTGKRSDGLSSAVMWLGGQDCQASQFTSQSTAPPHMDPALKALQLAEALRALLEGQGSEEEQESLKKQVSTETACVIVKWLERHEVSTALATDTIPGPSNNMYYIPLPSAAVL